MTWKYIIIIYRVSKKSPYKWGLYYATVTVYFPHVSLPCPNKMTDAPTNSDEHVSLLLTLFVCNLQ